MAMWLLIMAGTAFVGAAVVVHAAGASKRAGDNMLEEYSRLLAQAREARQKKAEQQAAAPPPVRI